MINLLKLNRVSNREDVIVNLLKLYEFKGKDYHYMDLFCKDINAVERKVINTDLRALVKLLGLNITDARKSLIMKKEVPAKNKDEQLLINLKGLLYKIQKNSNQIELISLEFTNLVKAIFKDVEKVDFIKKRVKIKNHSLFEDEKTESTRNEFESEMKMYSDCLNSGKYEVINLMVNFYVDFINQNIFTNYNDFIGLFFIYVLLFKAGFEPFHYVSFFDLYMKKSKEFEKAKIAASINYSEGFSNVDKLNNFMIELLLEGYKKVDEASGQYTFELEIKKVDDVISSIYKLPKVFTKDDIRAVNPYISDSTIKRALNELKRNKVISPIGTGRTAKWMRFVEIPEFNPNIKQMNIFSYEDEEEDE